MSALLLLAGVVAGALQAADPEKVTPADQVLSSLYQTPPPAGNARLSHLHWTGQCSVSSPNGYPPLFGSEYLSAEKISTGFQLLSRRLCAVVINFKPKDIVFPFHFFW